jgi:hypothetical protein
MNPNAMSNTSSLIEARPMHRPMHDHKAERDALKHHNERRQDLLKDAQRLADPGYDYATPILNPFAKPRLRYLGEEAESAALDHELKKGTWEYVKEAFESSSEKPRTRFY